MEALTAIIKLVHEAGVEGCLIIFVVGLRFEWWVMGGQYRAIKPWQDAALRERVVTRRAVEAVEAVA